MGLAGKLILLGFALFWTVGVMTIDYRFASKAILQYASSDYLVTEGKVTSCELVENHSDEVPATKLTLFMLTELKIRLFRRSESATFKVSGSNSQRTSDHIQSLFQEESHDQLPGRNP